MKVRRSQPSAAPTGCTSFQCRSCRRLRSFDVDSITKTAPEGAVSVYYRVSLKRSTRQTRLLYQVQQRLWIQAEEERQYRDGQQHHAACTLFQVQLGIVATQVWFDQVQGDHDTQVVEHADGAAQYQGADQPPLLRLDTGGDDVELADEARGQRDTSQGQHHHGQYGSQVRTAPEQAAVFVQGIGVTAVVRRGHQGDHAEGAKAGDHVGDQVHADGFHGQTLARHQGDQQVTEVSNGRVTQQTLEVALGQRQQVTEQDRRDGDDGQHVAQS